MRKIKKLLIANRGEIVERIIRTCNKLEIESIAIFSDNDKNLPYINKANISVAIGNSSYLDIDKIISIAKKYNADAIHAGYGFLSENYKFAERCRDENIIFVGPSSDCIKIMGDKIEALKIAKDLSIPIIESFNEDQNLDFPVIIKASLGGGGKGMKIAKTINDFRDSLDTCKRESYSAFGSDSIFIQKFFENVHHIEIQIIGDNYGNYIHLYERECSIQRRYQKILEETPSTSISDLTRQKLIDYSIKIAKHIGYNNVGTIEFLVENENVYFLEMNTRLQVEHAITEEVTGFDLVKLQLEISEGKKLDINQNEIESKGHAIEVRLYAEDPENNFTPSIGKLLEYYLPQKDNIRIENTYVKNTEVTSFYDPMITKIISYGKNRNESILSLKEYLKDLNILGFKTNKSLLIDILNDTNFLSGDYNTSFIEKMNNNIKKYSKINFLIASTLILINNRIKNRNVLKVLSSWSNTLKDFKYQILEIDSNTYEIKYLNNSKNKFIFQLLNNEYVVELIELSDSEVSFMLDDLRLNLKFKIDTNKIYISDNKDSICIKEGNRFPVDKTDNVYKEKYLSALPGEVSKIFVSNGQSVIANTPLLVINSMKMENTIFSTSDCVIEEVFVSEKMFVKADSLMIKVKPIIK